MSTNINIVISVDVIAALSDRTLENNVFIMDNSSLNSTGQGTADLTTLCKAGQKINWIVYAIDVQTPVAIKNITFSKIDEVCESKGQQPPLGKYEWEGIVPYYMATGSPYSYKIELQMGLGDNSVMSIDSSSLMRV
jgi:hypothetical protein